MNNPNIQSSPALRIEAVSINCIVLAVFANAANRNLLTVADSLTAHNVEYLFLMRLIILIHLIRRNAQTMNSYDEKNNITKIEDKIEPSRTQEFLYDSQNRLTEAKGKYGVGMYEYADN